MSTNLVVATFLVNLGPFTIDGTFWTAVGSIAAVGSLMTVVVVALKPKREPPRVGASAPRVEIPEESPSGEDLTRRPILQVVGQKQIAPGDGLHVRNQTPWSPPGVTGSLCNPLVVKVENSGGGPAKDVFVAYLFQDNLRWSGDPITIGAGREAEIDLTDPGYAAGSVVELFKIRAASGPWGIDRDRPTYILCCLYETGEFLYRYSDRAAGVDVTDGGNDMPPWAIDATTIKRWLRPWRGKP